MRITNFRASATRLSAQVEFSSASHEVYFEFLNAPELVACADAFLVAGLLPAMRKRERIQVDGPVSPFLARSLRQIQETFVRWFPGVFHPIEIEVADLLEQPRSANEGATFFSLGVDSFYTAINASNCRYFVYMRAGVESLLEAQADYRGVEERIRSVAATLGKKVITGSTNMRDVLQMDGLDWGPYYNGAGLAAIGHALGLQNIYISSSHAINHLLYWGSHPAVDHLWSSERTNVVHFGAVSRAEKTLEIIRHPVVLQNLRVCVENDGGESNCGRCWKCVRTMLTLQILGLLQGAPFPYDGRSLHHELQVDEEGTFAFAEEIEDLLQRVPNPDSALLDLIQGKLNKRRRMLAVSSLLSTMPRLRESIRRLRSIQLPAPYRLPLAPVAPVKVTRDSYAPVGSGRNDSDGKGRSLDAFVVRYLRPSASRSSAQS